MMNRSSKRNTTSHHYLTVTIIKWHSYKTRAVRWMTDPLLELKLLMRVIDAGETGFLQQQRRRRRWWWWCWWCAASCARVIQTPTHKRASTTQHKQDPGSNGRLRAQQQQPQNTFNTSRLFTSLCARCRNARAMFTQSLSLGTSQTGGECSNATTKNSTITRHRNGTQTCSSRRRWVMRPAKRPSARDSRPRQK